MITDPRSCVRRLALARAISIGGGAAAFMALNVVIFDATGSPRWVAAVLFFTFGVSGLLSPVGGLISDRFDRRWVMIWSDVIGAICFFGLALAHEPVLLIAIAFVAAIAETPFWPASSAAIPSIAGSENLSKANALLTASRNFGVLVGPLIGGVMVASIRSEWVFVFNAITFLFSAALVASVGLPFQEERGADDSHVKGLKVGINFLIHERVLRTIVVAWIVLVIGMGMTMVADLPFVHVFGLSSAAYGVLIACWGGGATLGTLAGRWMNPRNEGAFLFWGTAVIALGCTVTFVSPWFALALGGIFVAGLGDAATMVAEEGIRQRRTPDGIRSRVTSVSSGAWQIMFALSFVFGGFAVDLLGARGVYGFAAVVSCVSAAILVPVIRIVRAGPPLPAQVPEPEPETAHAEQRYP